MKRPALLNAFTFTFNRVSHLIDIIPHFRWQALGANVPDSVSGGQKGWADVHVNSYFDAVNGVPWNVRRNTFNYDDTATWVKGSHAIKFGFTD